jgi:fatty-acyl-CoA synthase
MTTKEVIDYCKEKMAKFKVPKTIVFQQLEKTSTGKIQKFRLREIAKEI